MKNLIHLTLILFTIVSFTNNEPATTNIVYQDKLVADNHTWTVDSNQYHVLKFSDGHYSIRVDSPDHCIRSLAPYGLINFPYTVQVDGIAVLDNVSQRGNVAVVFNQKDNVNFTIAEIWTNGTFRIWSRVRGHNSTVVNYTYNSAIRTGSGSKNTIKVIQNQATMELQVNDVSMGIFKIALPSSMVVAGPTVATAISNFTPETGLFNNFSISKN